MTTTLEAPADLALVHCRKCGRPLTSPVSRVLRVGDRCRDGLTEHELTAAMTGATA